MFYLYKNAPLLINLSGIFAKDASLNVEAFLEPRYLTNERHGLTYAATEGLGGLLSFSYYLTGVDPLKNYIEEESNAVLSGNLGGLYFNSGYLKSYKLDCEPNRSLVAQAQIVFFDDLKGEFTPTYQNADEYPILNFSNITLSDPTNGNIGEITNITNLNYSYENEINPLYLSNDKYPSQVKFGRKEISLLITTDNLSGDLSITGKAAGITVAFNHPFIPSLSESITVSGILHQRNITTSVGDIITSNLSIRQNYVDGGPVIISVSPENAAPGSRVQIIGTNLKHISSLKFANSPATYEVYSDTEITGIVPLDGLTGPITVTSYAGETKTSSDFTVDYNSILVSGISPITGLISGLIRVSGNYFYNITDVKFTNNVAASFNVISEKFIDVTVPENAAWGEVQVSSSISQKTGTSIQKFVPIPNINSFTPTSGLTGDLITINGSSFSGVTGVQFNNLPNINPYTSPFSVVSNSSITTNVPSGNVKGKIKLLGQSGVQTLSATDFWPIVRITGLNPTSSRTGAAIEILGENFYSDLLYEIGSLSNNFLVSFGNGDVSGLFTRINNTKLTGLVPYNAKSGAVYLYNPSKEPYIYSGYFSLKHNPPTITSTGVQTGQYSGYGFLYGTNLYEASSVLLSGVTGNITVANLNVGTLGDTLSFRYPITTGGYYHIIVTTPQGTATGYSGFYIRDTPVIHNIIPTSGAIGNLITLSGNNLYSDSKVYFNNTGTEASIPTGYETTGYNYLKFYIPPGTTSGLNDILIYNNYGWVTGQDLFRLIENPQISGFSPTSGAYGDEISITGNNLGNVTGVYIGTGIVTSFSKIENTGITFTIPSLAETNLILLKSLAQNTYSSGQLNILSPIPTVQEISPLIGFVGDSVLISGNYFDYVNQVWFTGASGFIAVNSFTLSGTTGIYVTVPLGAQSGFLKLSSDRANVITSQSFNIRAEPQILAFSPARGIIGDTITINGTNLSGCTFLFENINSGVYITGDETTFPLAPNYIRARVKLPREIITGPIYVSGFGRIFGYSSDNFIPIPQISGFNPETIVTGNSITITGLNAGSLLNNSLFITGSGILQNITSGNWTVDYTNISGSHITDYTTGYVLITVPINNNWIGTGALFLVNSFYTGANTVTGFLASSYAGDIRKAITGNLTIQQEAPVLISFNPQKGNVNISITLSGSNLLKTTGVYLISGGTQNLCSITSTGQNQIIFNPPVGYTERSGQFVVYTEFGNDTTTDYFTVIDNPYISGFYPTQNITGEWIKISGSGIRDITGLYFNNNIATFSIVTEGETYILSGIVPYTTDGFPRSYNISIYNEIGSYTSSNQFRVHLGPTEIWGNLTGKHNIYSTGFVVQHPTVTTGNITLTSEIEQQNGTNFLVLNYYLGNTKIRVFSIQAT